MFSITTGYDAAFEVLGGAGMNDLLSPEQRKQLQAFKRKKEEEEASANAAWAARRNSNYL